MGRWLKGRTQEFILLMQGRGGVEHPSPALCKPLVGSSISGFHVRTLKELVRGEGLNMMNTL